MPFQSDEKFILLWWKLISIVSAFNLAVLIRYGLLLAPSKDSMTSHERWMRFLMVCKKSPTPIHIKPHAEQMRFLILSF
jgi:hypothetical protein